MARVTLNIAKAYDDGFIENIEKTKYFQLHKNAASRTDLYCFAIALCEMEGKEPTPISAVGASKSIVRTEFLTNVEPLLSCLYYDKVLKDLPEEIDEICTRDEVYNLVGYMDKRYDEIKDEIESLI